MRDHPPSRRAFVVTGLVSGLIASTPLKAAEPSTRDARLLELLGRPVVKPQPVGAYVPARRAGNLLYLSTTVARDKGVPLFKGAIGSDLTVEQGQAAARATALAILETLYAELGGSLDPLVQLVNMVGYVVSADGFYDQAKVMDGASAVMVDVLGPQVGSSSRSAIGIKGLTGNGAVAISAVAEVRG